MKTINWLLLPCMVFCSAITAVPAISTEIGGGYGKELRGNTDLEQYEIYVREPLSYEKELDSGLKLLSAVEISMAMIRERDGDNDGTARFSAMPQVILNPHPNINCIFGLGTGFMVGETEFTKHDLGGKLFFASKVGIQFLLGQHWSAGYFYYHQSNGGIYDHNASLNMHQLALSYAF